jgi:hypothetical protein
MSTAALPKIRERGYWHVLVRPTAFKRDLVPSLRELELAVESSIVQIRGWDYPHWPKQGVRRIEESIEGSVDWEDHKEYWRAYESGQFVHFFAMREDWLGENSSLRRVPVEPRRVLGYETTIHTFSEIFLFAARWTSKLGLGPEVLIRVSIYELAGRRLHTFDFGRVPFEPARSAAVGSFTYEKLYAPSELIANPAELAVVPLRQLFEQFHWDVADENVKEVQRKLIESRR